MESGMSADEIALYDRQIRLWGVQAQQKIGSANILLITIKGLGTEIAKNLVLAGVGSLTIVDNASVIEDDLGAQFFIREEEIGQSRASAAAPRLQKLNSRVKVIVETRDILGPEVDPTTYFGSFDVVIATDLPIQIFNNLNAAARISMRPFYAAGSHGLYGFAFADLIEHTYVIERQKSNLPTKLGFETVTREIVEAKSKKGDDGREIEMVTKKESYQPLILANTSPLPQSILSKNRKLKAVSPLLPCLRALWEFENTLDRSPSHNPEDLKAFTITATQKARELQLPEGLIKAEFLRSFLQNQYAEITPVCAVVGAQVAQDVINVLGQKEQPIQNMLLFDGDTCSAPIYALSPEVKDLMGATPI